MQLNVGIDRPSQLHTAEDNQSQVHGEGSLVLDGEGEVDNKGEREDSCITLLRMTASSTMTMTSTLKA